MIKSEEISYIARNENNYPKFKVRAKIYKDGRKKIDIVRVRKDSWKYDLGYPGGDCVISRSQIWEDKYTLCEDYFGDYDSALKYKEDTYG